MNGFVYAIGDETGRVKIGWSGDPLRRLAKISSDCSSIVTLLGLIPGTKVQEREIQRLLTPWKANREWFKLEGLVKIFVSLLPKPQPRAINLGAHPLRIWRHKHGLSMQELADRVGVDRLSVWRWERDKRAPRESILPKLHEITGLFLEDLRPDLAKVMRDAAE